MQEGTREPPRPARDRPHEAAEVRCPYCHEGIADAAKVAECRDCGAPHHLSCFQEHRTCSAHGCGSTRANVVIQGRREGFLSRREIVFPEWQATPDKVFPEARLRFVHAQRRSVGERCTLKRQVDALLVEPVPSLVECSKECR